MQKRLLVLVAVLSFGVMVGFLVSRAKSRILTYQGKTVTTWLFQLSASEPEAQAQAQAAFEALGTNAIPELARLVQLKDSRWRKLVWAHATCLPRRPRAVLLRRVGPTNACVIRPMAAQALGKFGPAAAPAVPALTQMLRQGGSAYEQVAAAQALAQVGAPALLSLADVIAHERGSAGNAAALALLFRYRWPGPGRTASDNLPGDLSAAARQQAIEMVGASGRTDELVIKVLARAAVDPAPGVRLAALKALDRANRNLQAALPQLISCANDGSPVIREWSARILGKISPPTERAIPALTDLAQDEAASVRVVAQAALEALNAGRTTNLTTLPK